MLHRTKTWAIRAVQVAFLCALILGLTSPVLAVEDDPSTPWPDQYCTVEWMLGHAGKQQLTLTCVPPEGSWNGALLVYAHGYVAPQKPLALPVEELTQITLENGTTLLEAILAEGFAFATTSYSKNGYAVEQADGDLDLLVDAFRSPYRELGIEVPVLLVGASEGGLITVRQIETDTRYQGGLALCGPVGGMPYQVEYLGDFRVVFDYFFPGMFNFGAVDVPEDAWMRWDDFYAPMISLQITTHPFKARELFWVTDAAYVPWVPETRVETTLQVLFYSIFGMNDAIGTTGGIPYDNQGETYTGSSKDFHLNRKVERVAGDPLAMAYAAQYYQPTGHVNAPLVTMHNTLDPAVPFQHELIYAGLVTEAGTWSDVVVLPPVARYGHCNFTGEEVLDAFGLLLFKTGLMPPMP